MPKRPHDSRTIYYVYVLFDWLGVPRYVGKGKDGRWSDHEIKSDKTNWMKNEFIEQTWIMLGELPKVKVQENISELEALSYEIQLIKIIGRIDLGTGPLTNMSDGGDGGDFGKLIKKAKANWSPAKRKEIGQNHSKIMRSLLDKLTPGEKEERRRILVINLTEGRLRAIEKDPEYHVKRGRRISEGYARRTPEQKEVTKQRKRDSLPSDIRSIIVTAFHASQTPEERSFRVKGSSTPEERRERALRARDKVPAEQRSAQVAKQQAELTELQQIKRAERARKLGIGTRWITDGIKNKRLKQDEIKPEGWRYGKIQTAALESPTNTPGTLPASTEAM